MVDDLELEEIDIFPWNDNFETGIKTIDEQHKMLIKLLNKLANSLTQDETFKIEETFIELANYADFHFKSEEAIWNRYIKDEKIIEEHENSHSLFLPKVLELKNQNQNKPLHEVTEEILLFLIRWLAFHIIDEDKRLALMIHSLNEGKEISDAKFTSDNKTGSSMEVLIEAILKMYDNLSIKAIKLIKERKARIKAQKELHEINKKLEKLSITDQLTDIYNRRYFERVFQRELAKAKRDNTKIAVILFDIDFFKKLNDTYGHAKGDEALVKVASCLKKVCKRPHDFAFRIGGEEFTILITDEKENGSLEFAEILQKEIKKLQIENKNSSISKYLTISAGVASLYPKQEDTIESIMHNADEKLYEAKNSGRNIIIN